MSKRKSRWTSIYWDASTDPLNPGLKAYVRLTPDFMCMEAAGASHGISVGMQMFDNEADAEKHADFIDRFMDAMINDLRETQAERVIADTPLLGRWHHGNGEICNGSLRIATASIDTNPSESVRDEILDWMCNTLNDPKLVKDDVMTATESLIMAWSNMPSHCHRPLISFIRRNILNGSNSSTKT